MVPDFDGSGFPPPGRYRVTADEAHDLLVRNERFRGSPTRAELWRGFERYMYRFLELEAMHPDLVATGSLVHCVWLGGSYVSTKFDPGNIDLTVLVDDEAAAALRGKVGAKWLRDAFYRDGMLEQFGVSPIRLSYRKIASVFVAEKLSAEDQTYLRDRGSWDDWWQRCRQPGIEKMAPTVETARPARGYLEVTL